MTRLQNLNSPTNLPRLLGHREFSTR